MIVSITSVSVEVSAKRLKSANARAKADTTVKSPGEPLGSPDSAA